MPSKELECKCNFLENQLITPKIFELEKRHAFCFLEMSDMLSWLFVYLCHNVKSALFLQEGNLMQMRFEN